jgi:hypothetical protein
MAASLNTPLNNEVEDFQSETSLAPPTWFELY